MVALQLEVKGESRKKAGRKVEQVRREGSRTRTRHLLLKGISRGRPLSQNETAQHLSKVLGRKQKGGSWENFCWAFGGVLKSEPSRRE